MIFKWGRGKIAWADMNSEKLKISNIIKSPVTQIFSIEFYTPLHSRRRLFTIRGWTSQLKH